MSDYVAKPGSVADRAIAFLQSQPPAGAEISTSVLAEAVGVDGASLTPSLQPALMAGVIFARKKGGHTRSPLFWSLVDHSATHAWTGEAISPANGSQKPDGGAAIPAARAGRETPRKGDNRDASAESSHGAGGSTSPDGRGSNAAPARGASPESESAHSLHIVSGRRLCSMGENGQSPLLTPASLHNGREQTKPVSGLPEQSAPELAPRKKGQPTPEGRASQHVLKATAAGPDATDRENPANASPVGGPMGAGQPAAAGPAGALRIALWSDGVLQIERNTVGGAAELVLLSADETRALVRYLDRTLIADTEETPS